MSFDDKIPQYGEHSYVCFKKECFFCYEMARLQELKLKAKEAELTDFQKRKLKHFIKRAS